MRLVPLGSIADIQLGKMLSPKSKTGVSSFPYLRNQNVQWGRINMSDLAHMDFDERERQKFTLLKDDLIVCEGGEPGRCAIWVDERTDCYYQKALHRVRPHRGKADSEFLSFWLRYQASTGAFSDQNAKTTIAHLPLVRLEQLLVPDVSLNKQRNIAARLRDQFTALERSRQAAQMQLAEFDSLEVLSLNSVFENAGEWTPIGHAAKVQSGFAFKSQDFKTSGMRLLRNANIEPGRIYWDDAVYLAEKDATNFESYRMYQGDIVLSLDRPIISSGIKVARVAGDDLPSLLVQRVGRFVLNNDLLDADYLFAFLQSSHFIGAISGHDQSLGVPHISPGQVEAIQIPMPPVKKQRRIAAVAEEILSHLAGAQEASRAMLQDMDRLPSRLLTESLDDVGA